MDGTAYIGYWIRGYTALCFCDWVSGRRLGDGVNDQGPHGQNSTDVKHSRISQNKFVLASKIYSYHFPACRRTHRAANSILISSTTDYSIACNV